MRKGKNDFNQNTQFSNSTENWNENSYSEENDLNIGREEFEEFNKQNSSKKIGQIRFSHILVFVLLGVLIVSNLVTSRIASNGLTWFLLAVGFVGFSVLAYFILRVLYRLGYKIVSAFLFLPILITSLFFGANVAAVMNDSMLDESFLSEMPSKPQYVFYIHGKNNQLIQTFDESERFVSPTEMWESRFRLAAIALEDERFEKRYEGVIDARAVMRATVTNLWEWNTKEGASGIEIQTAKLLTGHYKTKSYWQKAGQGLIALRLNQRFPSAEEKFCFYGNIVDLVSGKRGVGAAASDLFGVSDLRQLSISQSLILAAMLKNPTTFNPRKYPEKNLERRNTGLKKMLELGFINESQYNATLKEEIKLATRIKPNELFIRAAVNYHNLEKEKIQ